MVATAVESDDDDGRGGGRAVSGEGRCRMGSSFPARPGLQACFLRKDRDCHLLGTPRVKPHPRRRNVRRTPPTRLIWLQSSSPTRVLSRGWPSQTPSANARQAAMRREELVLPSLRAALPKIPPTSAHLTSHLTTPEKAVCLSDPAYQNTVFLLTHNLRGSDGYLAAK